MDGTLALPLEARFGVRDVEGRPLGGPRASSWAPCPGARAVSLTPEQAGRWGEDDKKGPSFPAKLSPLPHLLLLEYWGWDWKGGPPGDQRAICDCPEHLSDEEYRTTSNSLFRASPAPAGSKLEF